MPQTAKPNISGSQLRSIHPLLACFAICCLATSSAAQDPKLVKRFLAEAPPAWEKFDEATKYAQGSIESTMRMDRHDSDEGEKVEVTFLINYALNASSSAIEIRSFKLNGVPIQLDVVQAFVRNPSYVLELERAAADKPWQTKHAGEDWSDAGAFTPGTARGYGEMPLELGRGNRAVPLSTLSECVVNPGFSIQDIEITPDKTWRIKFTFDPEASPDIVFGGVTRGVFEFDPEHNWRQVRSEFNEGRSRITYEFKYPDGDDAENTLPNLHVYSHYMVDPKTKELVELVKFRYEMNLAIPDKLPPDSEFTATAYGLKEPDLEHLK